MLCRALSTPHHDHWLIKFLSLPESYAVSCCNMYWLITTTWMRKLISVRMCSKHNHGDSKSKMKSSLCVCQHVHWLRRYQYTGFVRTLIGRTILAKVDVSRRLHILAPLPNHVCEGTPTLAKEIPQPVKRSDLSGGGLDSNDTLDTLY